MMRYVTIYDAASFEAFLNLAFVLPGVMIIIAAVHRIRHSREIGRGLSGPALRWVFLPLSVLMTVVMAGVLAGDAARAAFWASTGRCTRLEGSVQHVRPEPPGGHGYESFDLDGVSFRYSGPMITAGFHMPGLISEGQRVRICYHGAQILRLDVVRRSVKGGAADEP